MARTGITKAQVRTIREQLLAQQRYPSADAVRAALGDTGSKSTIHRYLKELAAEQQTDQPTTAPALQDLVERLAAQVYAETERRLDALRAAHSLELRQKDDELAGLRNTVAALSARLQARDAAPQPASPRESAQVINGFGPFGELLSNSRSGRDETSVFNLVRAGGRSNVLQLPGEQAA